jgi:hypothetical protein
MLRMTIELPRGRRRAPPPALNIPSFQDLLSKSSNPTITRTRIPTPTRILTSTPTILNRPLTPFESVPTVVLPTRPSTILAGTLTPTSRSQSTSSAGTQPPTVTVFVTPSTSISIITVTRPSASIEDDRVETPTVTAPASWQAPVQQSSNPSTAPVLASSPPDTVISGRGAALLAVLGTIGMISSLCNHTPS